MASDHTKNPDSKFRWHINKRIIENQKTYVVWQTNNGVHCAVTLEEVVTVWIVVLAHQLDILL
jgi:hypothetical protein